MENLRIKDIERILLTLYQFNYDSKVTPFYSHAAEELVKPSRKEEQQMFPKSLIYCAQYLLQANFCFKKILEIIMNPAFIKLTSANEICNAYIYIHNCLELDHPEIKDQFKLDNSVLTTFYTIAEQWNKNLKGHSSKRQQFAADVIYNFKV
ncbi:PREDICTED: uncharacterized protein LOC105362706 [Ceratosolen solmsi marchali]|uniref:Uncharacterized protein LOC105362706 n=1 Tax=Ceratosolen solmsi marchali TaxID=326594 RepID=A0AAJ7DW12_9HYME|nr:PREDICTED: uncharacterized protein LOC105362706 [Ceratosolen solmsi marchali]